MGYRDFGDPGDVNHFDILDYTTNLKDVENKIKSSEAIGGSDVAEDVKGALDMAYTLSHSSPLLLIYHICDAPSHGCRYHRGKKDQVTDSYFFQRKEYLENSIRKLQMIDHARVYYTAF